jgi:hypothetical protein
VPDKDKFPAPRHPRAAHVPKGERPRADHDRDHDRGPELDTSPEVPDRHPRGDHDEDRRRDAPPGLRKVVERAWYFRDDDRDDRRDDDCGRGGRGGGPGGNGGDGGQGGSGKPGRPTRPSGTNDGSAGPGAVLTTGIINQPEKPGVWGGTRADLQLPYLFMRANPGDLGARPVVNAPFWESPDIFILAGVDPASAPNIPPALGQVAQAGQPNTIYAHVWNFGNASANEVLVEFYWVNPALGISTDSVNLISQTVTAIGAKGSGNAHVMVKCPEAWVPTFVNGGHECLLVRVWDNPSDLPGQPPFDASWNRHVGQRNIHVNAPGTTTAGALRLKPAGIALQQPILIKVGPLFGAPATVAVERVAPSTVPWLQLRTGTRGVFPVMATPTGTPTLSPPTTTGGGFPTMAGAANHIVHGDDKQVAFSTTDQAPGPGEAHVYRVNATQEGVVFGGYTIVLLG